MNRIKSHHSVIKKRKIMPRLLATSSLLILLLCQCQKSIEIYAGLPMQPKNLNAEFKPGLNVFGMLKAGPTLDTINHFFEVHQLLHIISGDTNLIIEDADITLIKNTTESFHLQPVNNGNYTHYLLNPQPGDVWNFECKADTFIVQAQTRIPNTPEVDIDLVTFKNNEVQFEIMPDTTAFMYDIYYIKGTNFTHSRVIPEKGQPTRVQLNIGSYTSTETNRLYVIAFDKNYEKYVTTSNIFFKPNAYRPTFSTVSGGYGCFGSASSLMLDLRSR